MIHSYVAIVASVLHARFLLPSYAINVFFNVEMKNVALTATHRKRW